MRAGPAPNLLFMPAPPRDRVEALYRRVQALRTDLSATELGDALTELYDACLAALGAYPRTPLTTRIPAKSYFAFQAPNGKISRAVNQMLYAPSATEWQKTLNAARSSDYSAVSEDEMTRAIYCAAISFCAVIDLTRRGDQKTPGTFFEYLVGHLFALRLGVNPTTRLAVLNLDMDTTLPTDYIFDLGAGQPKFHLPIKTSTRERVIQVWAHQRVLDGVYGTGRFLGTPVILAETKTDAGRRDVVEICLPDQWRIYQMHIAQLKRVYYLDVPSAYTQLNVDFPPLHVVPFGRFFLEASELGF